MSSGAHDTSPLPRELVVAYLAAPLVMQPIVNADFFDEPAATLFVEVLANYVPACAMLAGLLLVHRSTLADALREIAFVPSRLVCQTLLCASVAAVVSALVRPIHGLMIGEHIPLITYIQRNVGFTCLVSLPVFALQAERLRVAHAERHALVAELDALRSRTEPHFLFNVLNTVASLVHDDAVAAEQTVHKLARILRYAQRGAIVGHVRVAEEIEIVVAYLEIQQTRFGGRLRYSVDVAEGAAEATLAPLLLQPLVENAVLHGIAGRASGGTLRVVVLLERGSLVLRVEDDGPGPGGSVHVGSSTSMRDLARRIALLHGSRATLTTRATDGGGFTAELSLPTSGGA